MHTQGQEIEGAGEGFLCMKAAWPSTIRTIFGDQDRFETTYFAPFKVGSPSPTSQSKVLSIERGVADCLAGWVWGGRKQEKVWRVRLNVQAQ